MAAVSLILPTDYIARDLERSLFDTVAKGPGRACQPRLSQFYRYGKRRLIDLLQITPAEERHMRALISDGEKHRRHLASDHARRRAAGMVERTAYLAEAAQRQTRAAMLRQGGLSWPELAHSLGLSTAEAAWQLARRACRMCDPKEPYGSALYILVACFLPRLAVLPSIRVLQRGRSLSRGPMATEAARNSRAVRRRTPSRSTGGTEVVERPRKAVLRRGATAAGAREWRAPSQARSITKATGIRRRRGHRGTPAQASGFHGVSGLNARSPISDPVCPQQAVAAPEANQGGAGQRRATRAMMRSAASIRRRRPLSTAARYQGSIAWPSSADGVEPDAVQEGRQQRNDGQRLVETRDRCRHRGERSKRGAISGNPVA